MTDGETMGQAVLQTCDVKIEQNTKGYNVSVHVYEFSNTEKIDSVIKNAVYAMKATQKEIAAELLAAK